MKKWYTAAPGIPSFVKCVGVTPRTTYSTEIAAYYHEGVSGGPASYASVENIKSVVSAVVTRLKRNPEVLGRDQVDSNPKRINLALPYPKKVTIPRLIKHVPVRYWISSGVVLFGAFVLSR